LSAAQDFHADRLADNLAAQLGEQLIRITDRLAGEAGEDITHHQSTLIGWTAALDRYQEQTRLLSSAQRCLL
jgi:hypothetical protein